MELTDILKSEEFDILFKNGFYVKREVSDLSFRIVDISLENKEGYIHYFIPEVNEYTRKENNFQTFKKHFLSWIKPEFNITVKDYIDSYIQFTMSLTRASKLFDCYHAVKPITDGYYI